MLAKRIIPCLDIKDGRVVKGVNFLALRDAGDPVEQAQIYDREGADELVFLDITASHERREIVIDMVRRGRRGVHSLHRWRRHPDGGRHARPPAGGRGQGLDQLARGAHAGAGDRRRIPVRKPVYRGRDRRQAAGRWLGGVHRRRADAHGA